MLQNKQVDIFSPSSDTLHYSLPDILYSKIIAFCLRVCAARISLFLRESCCSHRLRYGNAYLQHLFSFKMNESTKLIGSMYTNQQGKHLEKFTDMAEGCLETNSTVLYISPSKIPEKYKLQLGPSRGTDGKDPICQYRRPKSCGFNHWVGKIPWRGKWQPTPVFLPRKSHGQRRLVGSGLQSCEELGRIQVI